MDDRLSMQLSHLQIKADNIQTYLYGKNIEQARAATVKVQLDDEVYRHIPLDKIKISNFYAGMGNSGIEKNVWSSQSDINKDIEEAIYRILGTRNSEEIPSKYVLTRFNDEYNNLVKHLDEYEEKEPLNINEKFFRNASFLYDQDLDEYVYMNNTGGSSPDDLLDLLKLMTSNKGSLEGVPKSIFARIDCQQYSNEYISKDDIKRLEKNMQQLCSNMPSLYEIYDESGKCKLRLEGLVELNEYLDSGYNNVFYNKEDIQNFYNQTNIMACLKKNISGEYDFSSLVSKEGKLSFYYQDKIVSQETLNTILKDEYMKLVDTYNQDNNNLNGLKQEEISKELSINRLTNNKQTLENYLYEFNKNNSSIFGRVKNIFSNVKTEDTLHDEKTSEDNRQDKESELNVENITVENYEKLLKMIQSQNLEIEQLSQKLKLSNQEIHELKEEYEKNSKIVNNINENKKNVFNFIFSPKSSQKYLIEKIYHKHENKDIIKELKSNTVKHADIKGEKTIEYIANMMEDIQRDTLTKEERDAIYIYKTCAFTSINILKEYMNKKGENISFEGIPENIKGVLKEEYNSMMERYKHKNDNLYFSKQEESYSKLKDADSLLGLNNNSSFEDYVDNMINSTSLVTNALSKSRIPEDIVVYRAVTEDVTLDTMQDTSRFISTTVDPEIATTFWKARQQKDKELTMYKFKIKKGTPAIFYTSCMFEDTDEPSKKGFPDSQKEVLFDGDILDIDMYIESTVYSNNYNNIDNNTMKEKYTKINLVEGNVDCLEKEKEQNINNKDR